MLFYLVYHFLSIDFLIKHQCLTHRYYGFCCTITLFTNGLMLSSTQTIIKTSSSGKWIGAANHLNILHCNISLLFNEIHMLHLVYLKIE